MQPWFCSFCCLLPHRAQPVRGWLYSCYLIQSFNLLLEDARDVADQGPLACLPHPHIQLSEELLDSGSRLTIKPCVPLGSPVKVKEVLCHIQQLSQLPGRPPGLCQTPVCTVSPQDTEIILLEHVEHVKDVCLFLQRGADAQLVHQCLAVHVAILITWQVHLCIECMALGEGKPVLMISITSTLHQMDPCIFSLIKQQDFPLQSCKDTLAIANRIAQSGRDRTHLGVQVRLLE